MLINSKLSTEAICGCVSAREIDNLEYCSSLVGREKAESIVNATGFTKTRKIPGSQSLFDLMRAAAVNVLEGVKLESVSAIVVASFSVPERFPSMAARLQHSLGIPTNIAAIDLQAACSAYPYALMIASQLASATHGKVLILDGDVQSEHVSPDDVNTGAVMSDAATATLVSASDDAPDAQFSFYTDGSRGDVLTCARDGIIRMDGFGVFKFVAGDVTRFLKEFLNSQSAPDLFVPHQANMYMVRQLAKSLGLSDKLITSGERFANPGSCSVALTLAANPKANGCALLSGFGAGLSASAARVQIMPECRRTIIEI